MISPGVFLCNNATCGHFYHPKCVAQLLHPNNRNEALELERNIVAGISFTCPVHWCFQCKGLEDRTQEPLQFAVCRRCPRSYHRKCLPREISFEDIGAEGIITRAWELSKRILIYCLYRFLMPIVIYDIFLLYNRVLALVEKEVCSLTLDDTSRRCSIPSTYATSGRQIDKIIARGKLECSIQAVQAALQKLEHGDTIDDAKAVCEPEVLRQLTRWNNKLRVYLAPFIHGMRYTSFGRHFTKKEKLNEYEHFSLLINFIGMFNLVTRSFTAPHPTPRSTTYRHPAPPPPGGPLAASSSRCSTTEAPARRLLLRLLRHRGATSSCSSTAKALLIASSRSSAAEALLATCSSAVEALLTTCSRSAELEPDPTLVPGLFPTSTSSQQLALERLGRLRSRIVDFSCGLNDFSQFMKGKLDKVGKKCNFKNYDVIRPKGLT
nr:unnamed protein product [Digitaria exilis]